MYSETEYEVFFPSSNYHYPLKYAIEEVVTKR